MVLKGNSINFSGKRIIFNKEVSTVYIGDLLKYERKKQALKQTNLAKNICSPSYLSKIENNLVEPHEDLIKLLGEKLNIDFFINEIDVCLQEELAHIYKEIVCNKNNEISNDLFNKFDVEKLLYKFNTPYRTLLQLFRIYLKSYKKKEISILLDYFSLCVDNFNTYENYLYHQNLALNAYIENLYVEALNEIDISLNFINNIPLEIWEKADTYYIKSLLDLVNNNFLSSLDYVNNCLILYQDLFNTGRIIESYILLANINKRTKNFSAAEKFLNMAKNILINTSSNVFSNKYLSIILQNLGDNYYKQKKYEISFNYYVESYYLKDDSTSKLLTILSIVESLLQLKKKDDVRYWCDKGLNLLHKINSSDKSFYYHFNILKNILNSLNIQLICESIYFFEKTSNVKYAYKYCLVLSEYYYTENQYKNSSIYYKKAINFLENNNVIHF